MRIINNIDTGFLCFAHALDFILELREGVEEVGQTFELVVFGGCMMVFGYMRVFGKIEHIWKRCSM